MPSVPRPGSLKDPEVADLFSLDSDPEKVFVDLREIGHGSFGAVYYARNVITKEVVAIKKMSYSGKQSAEKWQDILKEVKILSRLKHRNTIDYKACYLADHTAWLVMEYCLGSAADIIEVHKKPLREEEIGAISKDVLEGLNYLHNQNSIHRDVKAGNILLTDSGLVKLADFGSASLLCPANSFVGTPYWMAPEVILAMDEGQYDGKADIWSLGITCIELAERKPPLFNMNAMSALYHIAQNESPSLSGNGWSSEFRAFVDSCLQKGVGSRPTASDLLECSFIMQTSSRSHEIVLDLIQRTKAAVREMDKQNVKRIKKILMTDDLSEPLLQMSLTASTVGASAVLAGGSSEVSVNCGIGDDSSMPGDDSSLDDQSAEGGSAGSSISSRDMSESNDAGSASVLCEPNLVNLPSKDAQALDLSVECATAAPLLPVKSPDLPGSLEETSGSGISTAHTTVTVHNVNNFATIRTPSIVQKQRKEYATDDIFREQMSGYKRMRRQHQKQLLQLEEKFVLDLAELKNRLDKECELNAGNCFKEVEKLRVRHGAELDKKQKSTSSEEQQLIKQLKKDQKLDMETFVKEQNKMYKQKKEQIKKELDDTPKKQRDEAMKDHKGGLQKQQQVAEGTKVQEHLDDLKIRVRRFKRSKLLEFHLFEQELIKEEYAKMQGHLDAKHQIALKHHETIQELEWKQQEAVQRMRDEQMKKQHQTELQNQREYMERQERELQKRHVLQLRQMPRSLKEKEMQIKKQFREAIKTQERQYKALKETLLAQAPNNRLAQKDLAKRLKDEQDRKSSALLSQYQQSIGEMLYQQNVRVDESQNTETTDLRRKLAQEYELLLAYQSKIRIQTENLHARERRALQERVSHRLALIEQKAEEEGAAFEKDRSSAMRQLHERQGKEIEAFDSETDNMGIASSSLIQLDDSLLNSMSQHDETDRALSLSPAACSTPSTELSAGGTALSRTGSVAYSTQL